MNDTSTTNLQKLILEKQAKLLLIKAVFRHISCCAADEKKTEAFVKVYDTITANMPPYTWQPHQKLIINTIRKKVRFMQVEIRHTKEENKVHEFERFLLRQKSFSINLSLRLTK